MDFNAYRSPFLQMLFPLTLQRFVGTIVERAIALKDVQAADGAVELVADEVETHVGFRKFAFFADLGLQVLANPPVSNGRQFAVCIDRPCVIIRYPWLEWSSGVYLQLG